MSIILVFMALIAGIAGWWLSRQRLMAKPWLEANCDGDFIPAEQSAMPAAKIGLGVFLAVVGALFSLLMSAYIMRMGVTDWRPLPMPRLLWANTAVLFLSSVALHVALVAARRGEIVTVRLGLATAAATAFAFLGGQLAVWNALQTDGYLVAGNPANSFFYVITGLHGLHIAGGLVGLARVTRRAWLTDDAAAVVQGVDLCGLYWHFLFAVWLCLFAVFAGFAGKFLDICRQLIS